MSSRKIALSASILTLALAGCSQRGELSGEGGIGVNVVRSSCPAVGVPDYTGDITYFNPPQSREAAAIDMVATLTNVRTSCNDQDKGNPDVVSTSTFDVQARRATTQGARDVILPYFTAVLRGGGVVVSKRIGTVTLHFADGQATATASGTGSAVITRAAATLAPDIRQRILRKRKPTDQDASLDPLAEPAVRDAVQRATFEVLIGFQLNPDQLRYNATR
ncbi:MAG: hypothetical protein DI623_13440 [Sphingomonas sanxanigenens]|uniref:Uncharacterized protein n=1 Tax=Sphingomonas sanxanigenens TaxID=397260 RepID=A0A2W5A6J3_9SPHN|nr:MAG: hypothetical protein DI623_13440 [Sphingomonas sanxanigenens]